MMQTEMTQELYEALGCENTSAFKGSKLPVENVTHAMALSCAEAVSRKLRDSHLLPDGWEIRLPSESQWEYTCRAGTITPFSFGETVTSDIANFNGEHIFKREPRGIYFHSTSEGGKFPPNAFGLFDMHGNLWEWCADNWLDDYSSSPRDESAYQNHRSPYRVARGGSWHEPARLCRSAARLRLLQSEADEFIGFRVICDVT